MSDTGPTSTVKSAMRTLDILELLVAQGRPLAAHEIATALMIPVSSLSYLLTTLAERGYVEKLGRRYGPGAGLERLQPERASDDVIARAGPIIRALRLRLNETVGFFIPRGDEVEAAVSEIGTQALRYSLEVGRSAPMHAFAAGKAILASYSEEQLAAYFARSTREAFTHHTLTDEDDLRLEIEGVRRNGFARTREEHTPGIQGMARVVMSGGKAAGAISVAIPLPRVTPIAEAQVGEALKQAVNLLEHPEAEDERKPAA